MAPIQWPWSEVIARASIHPESITPREVARIAAEYMDEHARMEVARRLVDAQAADAGLWFQAQTAPEAYLQAALRMLHAVLEGSAT